MLTFWPNMAAIFKMAARKTFSVSYLNSAYTIYPLYQISLKSDNVDFFRFLAAILKMAAILKIFWRLGTTRPWYLTSLQVSERSLCTVLRTRSDKFMHEVDRRKKIRIIIKIADMILGIINGSQTTHVDLRFKHVFHKFYRIPEGRENARNAFKIIFRTPPQKNLGRGSPIISSFTEFLRAGKMLEMPFKSFLDCTEKNWAWVPL